MPCRVFSSTGVGSVAPIGCGSALKCVCVCVCVYGSTRRDMVRSNGTDDPKPPNDRRVPAVDSQQRWCAGPTPRSTEGDAIGGLRYPCVFPRFPHTPSEEEEPSILDSVPPTKTRIVVSCTVLSKHCLSIFDVHVMRYSILSTWV